MRGKRAKQLRRMAEDNTVGAPTKQYGRHRKTCEIRLYACTRLEYQFLKRNFYRSLRGMEPIDGTT